MARYLKVSAFGFCMLYLSLMPIVSYAAQQDPPKRVLFMPSYNFDYLGVKWFTDAAMDRLKNKEAFKVTFSIENLQFAAHPGDEAYFETMATSLRIKYAKEKPDLIIAQYKQATQFLLRYGPGIFGEVPVVFAGLEIEDYSGMKFLPNYTGVTTSFNAPKNLDVIRQLHPNVHTIYVVAGVGTTEKDMVANVITAGAAYRNQFRIIPLNELPYDNLLRRIGEIGPTENAALLYLSMQIDVEKKILVPAVVARDIGRVARVPVYGMLDTYVGSGITGGYFINHEKLGQRAAEIGADILKGKLPADLSVVNEPIGAYTFDWRQLKRWEVDDAKLPPESIVAFREIGIWDSYKWQIIGAVILIILQGMLVVALLINRSVRKKAEQVVRESEERYREIMEQSSDAIAIVDFETKRMLEVNEKWRQMLDYSEEEAKTLTAYDIVAETRENIDANYDSLIKSGRVLQRLVKLRRRDGKTIEIERTGAVVRYAGKQVFMFINRDITAERHLQLLLQKDVNMAADVQKSLIPGSFDDVLLSVRTIYVPHHIVSGDFYDFAWSSENKKFSGYILDISGHGVPSSLQGIVVSAYFKEVLDSQMNIPAKLAWINQHVQRYFTDETYAAAIYFEFDFLRRVLNFSTAGIYGLMAHAEGLPTFVKKAGSLIGISDAPEFTEWSVPIRDGDSFYFMSDGIYDQLEKREDRLEIDAADFESTVSKMRALAEGESRRDDCCAVCVQVKGQPTFPIRFDLLRPGEYSRIRGRIRELLRKVFGEQSGRIDVAIGEAINNAARESMEVKIKFNRFGNTLVVRVKDSGKGFQGNERIAALTAAENAENVFEQRLFAEGGRGILIMVAWMDRVLYNRQGNEIMLMKRLTSPFFVHK